MIPLLMVARLYRRRELARRELAQDPEVSIEVKKDDSADACECSLHAHRSCCRKHRSTRSPNPFPWEQIPKPSKLHPEYTLTPIHSRLSYHLAFENLHCVRQRLDHAGAPTSFSELSAPVSKLPVFVSELSDHDSVWADGVQYQWSNEIYFGHGMFMQKQEIQCFYHKGYAFAKGERFQSCRHHSLTISKPRFSKEDGVSCVQAWVTNDPPRCPSHETEKWSSKQGYFNQLLACEFCLSDAECIMRLEGTCLIIRYTCYRYLGYGADLSDPIWVALLTGGGPEASRRRPGDEYDVFHATYILGHDVLGRPGFYAEIHRTPDGIFDVSSRGREYGGTGQKLPHPFLESQDPGVGAAMPEAKR